MVKRHEDQDRQRIEGALARARQDGDFEEIERLMMVMRNMEPIPARQT